MHHLFLPRTNLQEISPPPAHEKYLRCWLDERESQIVDGDVSSAMCLQSVMAEILEYGSVQREWGNIFDELLTDDGDIPIAYSEKFSERLYQFGNQWHQRPVHASHTRWWIGQITGNKNSTVVDHVRSLVRDNGFIYNPEVSSTRESYRMGSEYMMSLAMGLEILPEEFVSEFDRAKTKATSHDPQSHLSAEYFRTYSLELLDAENLSLSSHLLQLTQDCEAGSGYCDFNVNEKHDEHMGTASRTERDSAAHSPLATLHALYLSDFTNSDDSGVRERAEMMGAHLERDPTDIPSFQIRDLPQSFGSGETPLEVIAASSLIEYAD